MKNHDMTRQQSFGGEVVPVGGSSSLLDMDQLAEELVSSAASQGVDLAGESGLLTALTRRVLQSALEVEMAHHLGHDKHDPMSRNGGNSLNRTISKTVRTEIGDVTIEVPRDREGTFTPQFAPKRQLLLDGFDAAVISMYAKGTTTGDIAGHQADVCDTEVSRDLVSRVTVQAINDKQAWHSRPLDRVYPVVLIDAIVLKVRQAAVWVRSRPVYVVMVST